MRVNDDKSDLEGKCNVSWHLKLHGLNHVRLTIIYHLRMSFLIDHSLIESTNTSLSSGVS